MSSLNEQLIALGAVFEAATLVDRLARTGQIAEASMSCMISSLLVRNPTTTLDVYGGDDRYLQDGYRALMATLERSPTALQREPLRYALAMIALERQFSKRNDLLDIVSQRLPQIESQVSHFGAAHDNVAASFGALYQDTLSTLRQRIQVHGEMRFLQQPGTASRVRSLLFAGIRSARLWRQLGGHRWQLVFGRKKLINALKPMLHSPLSD